MSLINDFHGPNAGYVLELYERFLEDPDSVDPASRAIFEQWTPQPNGMAAHVAAPAAGVPIAKIVGAANLAQSIRMHGHHAARLDPLGSAPRGDPSLDPAAHGLTEADLAALPADVVGGAAAAQASNAAEAIALLRETYCGTVGFDFDHVQVVEERAWLREAVESGRYRASLMSPEEKRELLERLTDVEAFERFLHRTFVGQKRFSIEGVDILAPMLDHIIRRAAAAGTGSVVMGMAHRGRLNVLAHVLGKPYGMIIAESMGLSHGEALSESGGHSGGWTGDVKYHLGATRLAGKTTAQVTLASNASHLEFVDPVVQGMVRSSQERRDEPGPPRQDVDACLPILLHGDAAFPGEGIVAETLNLSRLPGYQTGGTIHIIVNNQLGFTTEPQDGRSTFYASDLARGFEIPVIHVNADDPDTCLMVARLALDYRQRFHKDFLIDLMGYRRWGHNEADEPAFTQPVMYAQIARHPTVRELWARELDREGIVPLAEAEAMEKEALARLQAIRDKLVAEGLPDEPECVVVWDDTIHRIDTAVPLERLRELNQQIHRLPPGFHLNPKLKRQLERRLDVTEPGDTVDWAHAEALAFASILADGTPIRLTGQDAERGTFSQRHLVFHDVETGATATPLQQMPLARASFAVHNSPLSEASVLGFEYGYSTQVPTALVLWEAQFGDFANAGQVIIDQYIAAARAKWQETPSLVLLLPHGYEGQGPEHSSGRLERFLQLAGDDNIRVVMCTTAAQYFHALRRHAALLSIAPRPMVMMTPKSLLRHPDAASAVRELTAGRFRTVIDDVAALRQRDQITRLVLCSGKVYVDLISSEERKLAKRVAVARVEELYPFPEEELRWVLEGYPNLLEVVWLQEEPKNMGAWNFVQPRLRQIAGPDLEVRYTGRTERASPAEGPAKLHAIEQARIVEAAFAETQAPVKAYGVNYDD